MSLSPPLLPEREAIASALSRIQGRLRFNRALSHAALIGGLILLVLVAWRALRWLSDGAPAIAALVILLAILAAVVLIGLLLRNLLKGSVDRTRAAIEADSRANLKDELTTAAWFLDHPTGSDWVAAQLARAGRTVQGLEVSRVAPLRVPRTALVSLTIGALALLALWRMSPMQIEVAQIPSAAPLTPQTAEGAAKLRQMIAALPDSPAARKLEAALNTLEGPDVTPEARSRAIAQAEDAIEQIKIESSAKREKLAQLSEMLRGQPGMEAVAEALAAGDAKRAAQLLAQIEREQAAKTTDSKAPEPTDSGASDKSLAQTLQEATQGSGAESQPPSERAMKEAVDRLNEIARELQAASYVNEAWKQVKGPQLNVDRSAGLTAGRYAEQTQASSTPSPGTGETPMGGGTMFRSAAVAEGKAKTEQEGGTRAGDALGDAPPDPLLGGHAERLDAQLKRAGISGEEQEGKAEDKSWFYAESQQQKSVVSARSVQSRGQFANAEASSNSGISIEHRQIVKDYFMKLREGAR
ncbi:MAG TPA: hypothetical protein VFB54_01945 [Burkholderiales bacterium]|nr:hypothetical protein [Burkholderiales bacterium]